jgi:hypothetical protein
MNRSYFRFTALLGLSLLSVNVARGQLLSDESETFNSRSRPFSQMLEIVDDCAYGAINRCDEQGCPANAQQISNSVAGAGEQTESFDGATDGEFTADEAIAPEAVVRQSGDDYPADDVIADEDGATTAAADAAIDAAAAVAPQASSSVDDADYQDEAGYQETAENRNETPAANSVADEGHDSDADWIDEPSAEVVAAPVVAPEESAESYDAEPGESYQAVDSNADAPLTAENSGYGRQALLSLADMLDRLGAALQNVSCELTAMAAHDNDSIKR